MANLSALAQTQLKSAIDLLVNGTAYQTPLSEDVIERIAPVYVAVDPFISTGFVYEACKNNPKSTLLNLVLLCGNGILTTTAISQIQSAVTLMETGSAYETPFAEDVIERVAPAAVSSGFLNSTGQFYEDIKNRPVSTCLKWALYLGSM